MCKAANKLGSDEDYVELFGKWLLNYLSFLSWSGMADFYV